ncbi:MAG: helix-turn-helix transcriptional regulator, partial [Chloroflexota bacterium]
VITIEEPFALVLDDYHVLDSKPIDEMLSFLLNHLPAHAHLVVTTREDPSLPLSRMRVRHELTEIRAADLQFSKQEAAQFLNQRMDLNLNEREIEQLEERTEGWAAGLQMAALSMRGRGRLDTETFIQSFAGSHRFVLDYLAEEVLNAQSEQLRLFLLNTSILDKFSAPLCDAVTGRKGSQEILLQLERSNMLIVPLDDQRQWFRYHHLFAEVLQAHASLELSDQLADWHLRASRWLEAENFWPEAIHHAQRSGDLRRGADLIECAWPIIPKGIKPQTWISWAKTIPAKEVSRRPVLSAAYGWMSLDIGDLDGAENHLKNVEQWLARLPEDQAAAMIVANDAQLPSLPGTTACARAYLAQAKGDFAGVMGHAQRALNLLANDKHYWRGNAALLLGMAQAASDDLQAATQSILASIASQKKAENGYFQMLGAVHLAEIRIAQGRLGDALAYYEKGLALAEAGAASRSRVAPITINLYVGLGNLYREWGELETAAQYLAKGQAVSDRALMPASHYPLYLSLAHIKM